jgi:CheY-like chemotaxis protein
MMPDLSGFDVLRRIREQSRTPVLMLTAWGDTLDRVLGLELGADDDGRGCEALQDSGVSNRWNCPPDSGGQ